tara:strand:+ start:430 stop:1113 length:684 start_codon:yes stop_codon:yes gene_type:complete
MEIRWKKRDIERLFTHNELFSVLAVYQEFKDQGENYLDNLKPKQLQQLFVSKIDDENVPPKTTEPLHSLFDVVVGDFSEFMNNPEGYKKKVKERSKDPVRKMIDEEEFRNAMKFVLVYRIVQEKKTTFAQAKDERERIMNMVLDEAKDLLMAIVMSSAENVIGAADKYELDAESIKRLTIRIDELFDDGYKLNLCLDGKPLGFDDDLSELLKDKTPKDDNSFNPMFG